jgi:hypothetical protein
MNFTRCEELHYKMVRIAPREISQRVATLILGLPQKIHVYADVVVIVGQQRWVGWRRLSVNMPNCQ